MEQRDNAAMMHRQSLTRQTGAGNRWVILSCFVNTIRQRYIWTKMGTALATGTND